MVRPEWTGLNGLWELSVIPADFGPPLEYPHQILVPFPVESGLSGVARAAGPEDRIWYRRTFSLPNLPHSPPGSTDSSRWFLHFGAEDWEAEVYLNGALVATLDGYTSGYQLIRLRAETAALLRDGENSLAAHVRQTSGGQNIDLGIVEGVEVPPG